jgi:hypothetical protein
VVRVADTDGNPTDQSDRIFTISQAQTSFITVSSPNGGENWPAGSDQNITWTSVGTSGTVNIHYSTNNGSNWTALTAGTPDDGTYQWTVLNTPSANCLVRVADTDGSPADQSNAVFTIPQSQAPFITLGSPNGGEDWQAGSVHDITWTSSGTGGTVKIDFSKDEGTTWAPVSFSTPDDGTYSWTIPNQPSTQCLVRVTDMDWDPADYSDALFTISQSPTPFITVSSPNGGENWLAGSIHGITWVSGGTSGTVKIDYSTDNGSTWEAVIAGTPDDHAHSWTVPNTVSSNCLVKVEDADGSPSDRSNAVFMIYEYQTPFVTVDSPNGGENWLVGSGRNITWTSNGTSGTVNIDYSTDKGATWTAVTAGTPDDGTYSWTIPNTTSTDCLVKVEDTDGSPSDQSNAVFTIFSAFYTYTARQVNASQKPAMDGKLDDAVWSAVGSETLARGGKNDAFNQAWASFSDNMVTWKAVWCAEDNKLYVGVNVVDDVRGTADNDYGSANQAPWQDDSIEFFTDGDNSHGGYDTYGPAQQWRVTTKNNRNLYHYTDDDYHLYKGDDFTTFIQPGDNGNWTIEAAFSIYDNYQGTGHTLKLGDVVGWEVWYNDSDDKTQTGGYYMRDVQTGWCYTGPAHASADYFAELVMGDPVDMTGVAEGNDDLPESFKVGSGYPNPFNGMTMVEFVLPQSGKVGAEVYNMLGEKIRVLSESRGYQPGSHGISWDGRDDSGRAATSGMYFIRLQCGAETRMVKVIYMR